MIHERRASAHVNTRHLAEVKAMRYKQDRIEPVSDRRIVAPAIWEDDEPRDPRPWRERHPHAVRVAFAWLVVFAFGAECAYVLLRWVTD